MALPLCAEAQHYIGVRGGYGLGYGRFNPRKEMQPVWGLWSGGFAWKYYTPQKFLGGVGAEVEFIQRAYQYLVNPDDETLSYRRTVNTINVPFIWQPHFNIMNNRMRIFLNLGVFAAYNFSSKEEYVMRGEGVVYRKPYEMRIIRDNPLNFGLQGGLGVNVILGKIELAVEGRYYFSYGDILRTLAKYQPNNILRSPLDNFNISLGLFYRIGDKPHEPPMGPKAIQRYEARMAAKAVKKAEKLKQENNGSTADDSATESSQTDTERHQ
jgi:hypothetical protein